ncbi:MAG TPA: GxxExxY protein [Lacunisphaera sp.]|nr:GxxExxY protein [Lacunisphaera sp.]
MDTDAHRYDGEHAALTFAIIGCAMEVLNELGSGLHEKPYENALIHEFGLRGIAFDQQRRFPIDYKGMIVGEYIPDLIANGSVVVDAKVIDRITDVERGQMLNYLKITSLRVGLIINFKRPKLEWERVIL